MEEVKSFTEGPAAGWRTIPMDGLETAAVREAFHQENHQIHRRSKTQCGTLLNTCFLKRQSIIHDMRFRCQASPA